MSQHNHLYLILRMKIDFSIFYSEQIKSLADKQFDLYISAFDGCPRTVQPFNESCAKRKVFLSFPQQEHRKAEIQLYSNDNTREDLYIQQLFKDIPIDRKTRICIDCTGFLIPHLIYIIGYLYKLGTKTIHIVYNEPEQYINKENTIFSKTVYAPTPIHGFEAITSNIGVDEILIIETGFQSDLIREVIRSKSKAFGRHCLIGFPSMHADMYQHNLIQLESVKNFIGSDRVEYHKAPAYDPFITANKIMEIVSSYGPSKSNIFHIAPLSTKPQAIGAALSYIALKEEYPIDIIYPNSKVFYTMNTIGIHRRWLYTIELSSLRFN